VRDTRDPARVGVRTFSTTRSIPLPQARVGRVFFLVCIIFSFVFFC
jgi:hypothetical protein